MSTIVTLTFDDEDVKFIEHKIGPGKFIEYVERYNYANMKAKANSGKSQLIEDAMDYYVKSKTVPTNLDEATIVSDFTSKAEYETRIEKIARIEAEEKAAREA